MNKGVIINLLCTNPDCEHSQTKLKIESPLIISNNNCSFKILKECPRCKSGLEFINFVSGRLEITADNI